MHDHMAAIRVDQQVLAAPAHGGDALAAQLIISPRLNLFKQVTKDANADPEFAANIITQRFVELRRNGIDVNAIPEDVIIEIFKYLLLMNMEKTYH